jgi:hypothetical protein
MTRKKNIKVVWVGKRKPTARDLRAIGEAIQAGELKDGDTVDVKYRRGNPTDAEEAYTAFHWGRKPRGAKTINLPDFGQLYVLGKLTQVEYEAKKGDTDATWVHDFEKPYPVLTATPDGKLGPIVGGRAHVTERGIER